MLMCFSIHLSFFLNKNHHSSAIVLSIEVDNISFILECPMFCFVLLLPCGITFCVFFPSYFLLMDAILETLFDSGFSKNTSRRCWVQFGFLKTILLLSSLGSRHNSSGYPSIARNHFSLWWPCVLLGITSKQNKSAMGSLPLIFLLFCNH